MANEIEQADEAVFVGLDLAWSLRNNTAGAVARWDATRQQADLVEWREQLGDNEAIIAWLGEMAGSQATALIAIDAPLVVPNCTGARPGEKLLSRVFRQYEAGAHPANRTNLGRYGQPPGDIRGETLAARLVSELNFRHDPLLEPRQPTRQFFECYPHPAMIVLFELATTLKYKRKLRSRPNDRYAEYALLQSHLLRLAEATPALVVPAELLSRPVSLLRGAALKHYEDLLDAIVCAYIALYYWWWGSAKVHIFGDLVDGYIVAPVTVQMLARLIPEKTE